MINPIVKKILSAFRKNGLTKKGLSVRWSGNNDKFLPYINITYKAHNDKEDKKMFCVIRKIIKEIEVSVDVFLYYWNGRLAIGFVLNQ